MGEIGATLAGLAAAAMQLVGGVFMLIVTVLLGVTTELDVRKWGAVAWRRFASVLAGVLLVGLVVGIICLLVFHSFQAFLAGMVFTVGFGILGTARTVSG